MGDFKVYVPTLDEECLIPYTIGALLKVLPPEQIEVIDLGSKDDTLNRIPGGVKIHEVTLPADNSAGRFFTDLKNEFSDRQEWVLWVDGDEIYPVSTLRRIVRWVDGDQTPRRYIRFFWRVLRLHEGRIQSTVEYLSAGPKLFNSKVLHFRRAWPREVVSVRPDVSGRRNPTYVGSEDYFNGMWFWHGVLLKRSSLVQSNVRSKKLFHKNIRYGKLTWEDIVEPWNNDYEGAYKLPWTVSRFDREEHKIDKIGEVLNPL